MGEEVTDTIEVAVWLLPKGAVLLLEAEFDNTANNPLSIDPDQWVTWGQRSVDAMAHMFICANYLTDEEYDALKAERERRLVSEDGDGGG